jgi:hypothetical protein
MPFGLTNAPASFQHLMNHVFRDLLDICVIVYLDDILVYSKDPTQHVHHVREVLRRLRAYKLFAKLEKCLFHARRVEFLGFIASADGITMDPGKVKSVTEWPAPGYVKAVQSFLGFANFYRRFIRGFSTIARPLHALTHKTSVFHWGDAEQRAFDLLKSAITSAPVLRHFDPQLPVTVETDSSDYAIGAVLSQTDDKGLRPVAFASRGLHDAELNYPIHDKELLAIVYALTEWRHYLEGLSITFVVLSDHRSLEYFLSTKDLNRRQARWSELLAGFNFKITYRPGVKSGKPDALSRRPDYHPNGIELPHSTPQSLLQSTHFNHLRITSPDPEEPLVGPEGILAASTHDPDVRAAHEDATAGQNGYSIDSRGLILKDGRILIPSTLRSTILRLCHDHPTSGHPGRRRTLHNVRRHYWWPRMTTIVHQYVDNCHACQTTKLNRQRPAGLLMPLPVPETPFANITLDMIGELPSSQGFNAILVVVDRLTKMAVFIPTTTKMDADEFARLFFASVFPRFGLPTTIVSDRGSVFLSRFWKTITELLAIDHRYSTAYHPQTDGQTEVVNQWLEQYLRVYIARTQDDWSTWLAQAEFCYNSTTHTSTELAPFEALQGYSPRRTPTEPLPDKPPTATTVGALDRTARLTRLHALLKDNLSRAQERYKRQYDKTHRYVSYDVGDKVYLRAANIRTFRPSKKLSPRHLGPFVVTARINDNAVRLALPASMRVHPVFHISLLSKARGEYIDSPDDLDEPAVDDDPTYELERLLDHRTYEKNKVTRHEYRVKWLGYSDKDTTWEAQEKLEADPRFNRLRKALLEEMEKRGRGRRVR